MNPDSSFGLLIYCGSYLQNALSTGRSPQPALKNYSVNKERKVSSETVRIS